MSEEFGFDYHAPIETNDKGGMQSKLEVDFSLLDIPAMFRLGQVLTKGKIRYERDNWRKIDVESHLNHAIQHIMAFIHDKRVPPTNLVEDHLGHAFTRLMMAIGVEEDEKRCKQ